MKISGTNIVPIKCDSVCYASSTSIKTADIGLTDQIKQFFTKLVNVSDFPPRWHCGAWTDFHGWLYLISDVAIGVAYFAIPFLLFRIVRNRKDIPFPKIIWLFIAFILLCGSTHLLDALFFWWPAYRLGALLRFFTGAVSLVTVYALYKIIPMINRLRTLDQLEKEIEERQRAEEEMRRSIIQKQASEDLMAKKDEFMSIASHELKTPITTLKASLQVLERTVGQNTTSQPLVPFVARATKQVQRLTSLVNELLDVTRIQAGKLELNKTTFTLTDLVDESVEHCAATDTKHLLSIEGDKTLQITADYSRIDQVVCNFLTNAFKYSPVGTKITVSFDRLENGATRLTVSDEGVGIAEDKINHVFDRFFRVENTSQNYSGMGLGLYISSEIIKQHGGEIGVYSTLGKGASFWFTI